MVERWKFKRLTRADTLVVGALCLLLLVLVPVLLARPREQSARRLCAANLAQIGKLMLMYANDYDGVLPRAGGRNTAWGLVSNWLAPNRYQAFGLNSDGFGGAATVSSCFYLLVKYYQAPPRLFLCRDDQGTIELKLSDYGAVANLELSDVWDFGSSRGSYKHCSYSYHVPFGPYALTTARDPNLAVAADRNPFLGSPMAAPTLLTEFKPDIAPYNGTANTARKGNAITHARDGQNVLFLDGRVTFEKRSYCGVDHDNIYLVSSNPETSAPYGLVPLVPLVPVQIMNRRDSVLVHDPDVFGSGPPPRRKP